MTIKCELCRKKMQLDCTEEQFEFDYAEQFARSQLTFRMAGIGKLVTVAVQTGHVGYSYLLCPDCVTKILEKAIRNLKTDDRPFVTNQ